MGLNRIRSKKERELESQPDILSIVIRDKSGKVTFDGKYPAKKLKQEKHPKKWLLRFCPLSSFFIPNFAIALLQICIQYPLFIKARCISYGKWGGLKFFD